MVVTSEQQIIKITFRSNEDPLKKKLLSIITDLSDERDRAKLLALLAEKLEKRERKEAFNIVLELKPSLQKGLALINFLKYLNQEETLIATDKIIDCIKNDDYTLNQINLVQTFLNELELKEYKSLWLNCITTIFKALIVVIKENCEIGLQLLLLGKLFKLMYSYNAYAYPPLYLEEKQRLIEQAEIMTSQRPQYFNLLLLLENFPLDQVEADKMACFALRVLKETIDKDPSIIRLKEKVDLLRFLPRTQKIEFAKTRYDDIHKELQGNENNIINIVDFFDNMANLINYCYLDDIVIEEQTEAPITIDQYAFMSICDLLQGISEIAPLTDDEYYNVINTLIDYGFPQKTRSNWIDAAISLTKLIKCRDTKTIAILSILPKSNLNKERKQLTKDALETVRLVLDQRRKIHLIIQMFPYLPNSIKEKVIEESFLKMAWFSDLDKRTLVEELTPYLSHSLVKRAFEIAKEINSEEQRFYALASLFVYLNKADRQYVIKLGLGLLKTTKKDICVDKIRVIKELIKFIS